MDGTQTVNLNQNTADCIKEVGNIGSTLYTNICSGSQTLVPWGAMGWIGWVIIGTIFGVIILGVMAVIAAYIVMGFLKALGKDI